MLLKYIRYKLEELGTSLITKEPVRNRRAAKNNGNRYLSGPPTGGPGCRASWKHGAAAAAVRRRCHISDGHNTCVTGAAASATRWSRSSGSWMAMSATADRRDASDGQKDTDYLVLLQNEGDGRSRQCPPVYVCVYMPIQRPGIQLVVIATNNLHPRPDPNAS